MTLLHFFTNAQTIILSENFTGNSLPVGWSIDSAGVTPAYGWVFSGMPNITGNGFMRRQLEGQRCHPSALD